MKKDYAKTADTLIAALGGKDNITRLFHCMTRLRFYVKDRSKINEKEILKLSEISGVNWHEDQFQVIAGNEVNAVYKALEDKGVPTDDAPAANSDSSKSVVSKVIDAITGCMTPMIPALTAAGMIKVVLTDNFSSGIRNKQYLPGDQFYRRCYFLLHAVPDRSKCCQGFPREPVTGAVYCRCLLKPYLCNYGSW